MLQIGSRVEIINGGADDGEVGVVSAIQPLACEDGNEVEVEFRDIHGSCWFDEGEVEELNDTDW